METVTVKNKVYQIGMVYRSLETSETGYLKGYNNNSFFLYLTRSLEGRYVAASNITVIHNDVGEVTDAPIELEDGEWYMCEYRPGNKSPYKFMNGGWDTTDDCEHSSPEFPLADYRPLFKMVKA